MSPQAELEITFDNRSGFDIDPDIISANAIRVLTRLGYDFGELGISLVTPEEMASLNRTYMDREGPTDVLSFPLDAGEISLEADVGEAVAFSDEGVPLLLGDVVICPAVAGKHAESAGIDPARELCLMLIHGILHVAGYDHESDSGEMDGLQARLAAELCGDDQQ